MASFNLYNINGDNAMGAFEGDTYTLAYYNGTACPLVATNKKTGGNSELMKNFKNTGKSMTAMGKSYIENNLSKMEQILNLMANGGTTDPQSVSRWIQELVKEDVFDINRTGKSAEDDIEIYYENCWYSAVYALKFLGEPESNTFGFMTTDTNFASILAEMGHTTDRPSTYSMPPPQSAMEEIFSMGSATDMPPAYFAQETQAGGVGQPALFGGGHIRQNHRRRNQTPSINRYSTEAPKYRKYVDNKHNGKKIKVNGPCPCNSGKKFKKCCMTA